MFNIKLRLFRCLGFMLIGFIIINLIGCNKDKSETDSTSEGGAGNQPKHGLNKSSDATESPFDSMKPDDPEANQIALIEFEQVSHDFGKIKDGDIVKHTFKFKNVGTKNQLVITNVIADCGCTTPDWTREPIQPQKTGQITVQFNSSGKKGRVNKAVTVEANTEKPRYRLNFRAEVQ